MKLCFLGKFPPIEGGVSSSNYWLARGLAEQGHEIHVVTNACEVEERFRMSLDADDKPWYQSDFQESGGQIRVHNTESFSHRTMGHIPSANPFVSKLASLATTIVRIYDCEAIFAYYFEPYAVAGWLAAQWTQRPLIIKHAGSDLERLFRVPDLATTYKEILRSADAVITHPWLMPRFLGMGVQNDRLHSSIPFAFPTKVFHPQAEALKVDHLMYLPQNHDRDSERGLSSCFNPDAPTIGIYGKIGEFKGTYDLIAALGQLADEGIEFNLLAMIGSVQGNQLIPVLKNSNLIQRTVILNFLPNWRVPSFIRACTAVCFLERDFPIAIHGPMIPQEVLACGTCLVLSEEIASKQRYGDKLISGQNVILVNDPKDHNELKEALRSVVTDSLYAQNIGQQGFQLFEVVKEDYATYIQSWEKLFFFCTTDASQPSVSSQRDLIAISVIPSGLDLVAPEIISLLRRRYPTVTEHFLENSVELNPLKTGIKFCDCLTKYLENEAVSDERSKLLEILKYQKNRLHFSQDQVGQNTPEFPVVDRLQGQAVSQSSVWNLCPVRGNSVWIEEFNYNVPLIFTKAVDPSQDLIIESETTLKTIDARRLLVLFKRSINLDLCELQIDEATYELVSKCDGTQTTQDIVEKMCGYFGVAESNQNEKVKQLALSALESLYKKNVVVFGEQRIGEEWLEGSREA